MGQVSRVSINVKYATPPSEPLQNNTPEVEYRWGRIAIAVTGILLIATLFYSVFFDQKKPSLAVEAITIQKEMENRIASPPQEALTPPQKLKAQPRIEEPTSNKKTTVNKVDKVETVVTASPQKKALPNNAKTAAMETKKTQFNPTHTTQPLKTNEDKLAKIHLNSPHVNNAQLSQNIKKRTAVDELPFVLSVGKSQTLKVHFITDYQGLKNQWIYHDWYRDDVRMARIRIRPQQNKIRVLSSKNIDSHMLGSWQVRVVDQSDSILALGEFEVRKR